MTSGERKLEIYSQSQNTVCYREVVALWKLEIQSIATVFLFLKNNFLLKNQVFQNTLQGQEIYL